MDALFSYIKIQFKKYVAFCGAIVLKRSDDLDSCLTLKLQSM